MINSLDISISVYKALYGTASENVYDESVPNKLPDVDSFIVYYVGYVKPAHDYDTGESFRSYVMINCYAKNKSNGIKNTAKLKSVIEAAQSAITALPYRASISSIQISTDRIDNYHGQTIIYNILN